MAKIIPINDPRNANAIAFNNRLPAIVANRAATGQRVTLVDVYLDNDTTYTLAVDVGRALNGYRYSSDNFSGYKIELLAGETILASQQDSFVPLPGTFQDATLVFSANTNSVPTNLFGHALMIRLHSDHNTNGSAASTFFELHTATRGCCVDDITGSGW